MKKTVKTHYVCQACGYESPRWMGKCPDCEGWNTFVEEERTARKPAKSAPASAVQKPVSIDAVTTDKGERILTGNDEFDRVLGGGMVPGGVMLVGGAPGMGKSTLLLQAAHALALQGKKVLYISGEESLAQIKIRASRIGVSGESVRVAVETDAERICGLLRDEKPEMAVIDSIQTVFSPLLESLPGNISQVRYCGHLLTSTAKECHIPLFLVGHVNKEGTIAGPRVLEHLVDGLLMLEGDDQNIYRLLRSVKNRFGSTNEVGIFEMTDRGIMEVKNPSRHLLAQKRAEASGSVVTVSLEGTRPLLVEVQSLVTPTAYGIPQRASTGVDHRRLAILLAVLEKRAGIRFGNQDVFVNAAGGIRLSEPAVDLAVAMAMVSSIRDEAVNEKTAVVGEVGLAGEIRGVSQMEKRVRETERLGFTRMVLPKINMKDLQFRTDKLELKGIETVQEAVSTLFS